MISLVPLYGKNSGSGCSRVGFLERYVGLGEVKGEQTKLHNEDLDIYSVPNVITVLKLRRMKWAALVSHIERTGMHTGFWL
jgi:hypothetical protein